MIRFRELQMLGCSMDGKAIPMQGVQRKCFFPFIIAGSLRIVV